MQLKKLFKEDDAVSPVIGVILMVAITVILAAVIATFVLGLGEQVSDTAPQASFDFDFNDTQPGDGAQDSFGFFIDDGTAPTGNNDNITQSTIDGTLTIQHSNGPAIDTTLLGASGTSAEYGTNTTAITQYDDFSLANDLDEEISAGDSVEIFIASDDSISLVWTSDSGDTSATLQTYDGPDA